MTAPMLRALVVDDEVLARLALRQALAPHADVEVVGECRDAIEAIAALPLLKPDLLFLDVQMPGMDGFELLRAVDTELQPLIVFVTAFDQHALRAFEAQAMDYLLKPLDQERVDRALGRVRAQALGREPRVMFRPPAGASFVQRLGVKRGESVHLLRVEDIDWIAAQGNYVELHAGEVSYLHRETLSNLEARLDPTRFLRIHRSTLVNLDRVQEIQPLFCGDARVLLRTGEKLTLSRRYRDRAKALLVL